VIQLDFDINLLNLIPKEQARPGYNDARLPRMEILTQNFNARE
jgi:hypothetical protein